MAISVDITNTSDRRGEEVVQLYVRDEEATVARPSIELRGFQRVALAPGETRTIEFTLYAEQLAYTGADNRRVIEPGLLTVVVGRSAQDVALRTTLAMEGPIVDLPLRRHSLGVSRVI